MGAFRKYVRSVLLGAGGVVALLATAWADVGESASVPALTLTRSVSQGVEQSAGTPTRGKGRGLAGILSANSEGDVSLALQGVTVDIIYNDFLPEEVAKEQHRRITKQLDPLVNGVAFRVGIPF